jgi:tRNA (mo5U34)-methyltransferase
MNATLLERIQERPWFYDFDLPNGQAAPCRTPDHVKPIHTTRLEMLWTALNPYIAANGGDWRRFSAIDIACHQGFFTSQLARRGCRSVLGIDARTEHIADAQLIQQAYGLANLRFAQHDVFAVKPADLGTFDIVVCFGLLYHVDNPVGLLRLCRELTRGVCVIETQVVPNMSGMVDWGSYEYVRPLQGSFGIIDELAETHAPEASTTGICLCPSLEALVWIMKRLGFARVEQIAPPAGGYEQHRWNKRVVVAGYLR